MIDSPTMWNSFSWPPEPLELTHQLPSTSTSCNCLILQDRGQGPAESPFFLLASTYLMPTPGISSLKQCSPLTLSPLCLPCISFRFDSWAKERMKEHRIHRALSTVTDTVLCTSKSTQRLLKGVEPVVRHNQSWVHRHSSNWSEIICYGTQRV